MMILFRMLPVSVTQHELARLVNRSSRSRWGLDPWQRARIDSCEIFKVSDQASRLVEYHGLVDVQPAQAALGLIRKLNGKELRGKRVEVRKYFRRSMRRDQRGARAQAAPVPTPDRRKKDRRRSALHVEKVNAVASVPKADGFQGLYSY